MAHLWDTQNGRLVTTFSGHSGPITDVAFSLDGRLAVTVSQDGSARLHSAEECGAIEDLLALANRRVTRQLTLDERQEFLHLR